MKTIEQVIAGVKWLEDGTYKAGRWTWTRKQVEKALEMREAGAGTPKIDAALLKDAPTSGGNLGWATHALLHSIPGAWELKPKKAAKTKKITLDCAEPEAVKAETPRERKNRKERERVARKKAAK